MLVQPAWPVAVLVDVVVWVAWSLAVGWWAAHRPVAHFRSRGLLRLRPFEHGGEVYARVLRVKRWKDRLPEGGTWFGDVSKKALPPAEDRRARLARFAVESERAELTHWLAVVPAPLFLLWNPLWLFVPMVVFAVLANAPCVVVARYNRARVAAALSRP